MKRNSPKSNSDKKIEQLYLEAIRSAKEGFLAQPKQQNAPVNVMKNKTSVNAKAALKQAVHKQQERRNQRRVLSIQVSRLYPFNSETEGKVRTISRCSSEGDVSLCHGGVSKRECSRTDTGRIEETLHVMPIRATKEDTIENVLRTPTLRPVPPIYRTPNWANTIRLHSRCSSIPPRCEAWNERAFIPIFIEREELHPRSRKLGKDTMSLAAKRVNSEKKVKAKTPSNHSCNSS